MAPFLFNDFKNILKIIKQKEKKELTLANTEWPWIAGNAQGGKGFFGEY